MRARIVTRAVTLRRERSEPRRATAWAAILRGALRAHLRMTVERAE
jgi:hypothetical protein